MIKAILSMKDRLYQHGFIVHDDGENVNFSHVKTKNAAEKIGGADCRQKAILPPKGENSPFRK